MKKVWMYRNLHQKVWSVKLGSQGRVVHFPRFLMVQVEFRIQPAGRERARREKRKNVHAFAVGYDFHAVKEWNELEEISKFMEEYGSPQRITYSPFKSVPSFWNDEESCPINRAEAVLADANGTLWAWEPYLLRPLP